MNKIKFALVIVFLFGVGCESALDSFDKRMENQIPIVKAEMIPPNPTSPDINKDALVAEANRLMQDFSGAYNVSITSSDANATCESELLPLGVTYNDGTLKVIPYMSGESCHQFIFSNYQVNEVKGKSITFITPIDKKSRDKGRIEENWKGISMMTVDMSSDPVQAKIYMKYDYERVSKGRLENWGQTQTETVQVESMMQLEFSRLLPSEDRTDCAF